MLTIVRPVTTWQEFEFDFDEFCKLVIEFRYFDKNSNVGWSIKDPEITVYRNSDESRNHMTGLVNIPASILPGKPENECDWDDYCREHIEIIYTYLVDRGDVL